MSELIYKQAAIDEITEYGSGDAIFMSVGELKRRIEHLPSTQPERKKGADNGCTFLTCKHGGFGDDACSKCRWAYRDMYEADEEGAQDGQN